MRLLSCFLFLILSFTAAPSCFAYKADTHKKLVGYVFGYMKMHEEEYQDILKTWRAGMQGVSLAQKLKYGAQEADLRDDLHYKPFSDFGKWMGSLLGLWPFNSKKKCFNQLNIPNVYAGHFTAMQHFLVNPEKKSGTIWPIDGYSYKNSIKDWDDWLASASPLVTLSSIQIVAENCKSPFLPWFKSGVPPEKMQDFQDNFKDYSLVDLTFPPATNLAQYGYEEFLSDKAQDFQRPGSKGLDRLGLVLHLAQDMTVPHHVIGVLGKFHSAYEAWVQESLRGLIDDKRIDEHLRSRRCFEGKCSVEFLLEKIGEYTLEFEKHRDRLGLDLRAYNPSPIPFENLKQKDEYWEKAKDLVNLAIASNVVILKMAWRDWSQAHQFKARLLPVRKLIRVTGAKTKRVEPKRGFGSLGQGKQENIAKKVLPTGHGKSSSKEHSQRRTKPPDGSLKLIEPQGKPSSLKLASGQKEHNLPQSREAKFKTAREKYEKLPIDQIFNVLAPPNKKAELIKLGENIQDAIAYLAQDTFSEFAKTQYKEALDKGAKGLEMIFDNLSIKEIMSLAEKFDAQNSSLKSTSSNEAKASEIEIQQYLYSLQLPIQMVLLQYFAKRFPPSDEQGAVAIENHKRLQLEVKKALQRFPEHLDKISPTFGPSRKLPQKSPTVNRTDPLAQGCHYYASPDGEGNGLTKSTAFKVSDFWPKAEPGMTLCLLDGIFRGNESMIIPRPTLSGTAEDPISIKALHDGKATIDGQGQRNTVVLFKNDYFILEGFNAHSSGGRINKVPKVNRNSVIYVGGDSKKNIIRSVVAWNAFDPAGGSTAVFRVGPSANTLFEDVAGFGSANIIFDLSPRSHATTCRRCWGRLEGSQSNSRRPEMTYYIPNNLTGNNIENSIGTWINSFSPSRSYIFASYGARTKGENGISKILGSIAYLTRDHPSNLRQLVFIDAMTSFELANFVAYAGRDESIEPFNLRGRYGSGKNLTSIGRSSRPNEWGQINYEPVVNRRPSENVFDSGRGAQICTRYKDGLLTKKPLWPWPMNPRILEATDKYSKSSVDVTETIEEMFGPIPPKCRETSNKLDGSMLEPPKAFKILR